MSVSPWGTPLGVTPLEDPLVGSAFRDPVGGTIFGDPRWVKPLWGTSLRGTAHL
jgi:hypothetical protein